jgi:hypothetical protein
MKQAYLSFLFVNRSLYRDYEENICQIRLELGFAPSDVKKDRERRGATFNCELYKVFKNTRKRKAKSNRVIDPTKQRPLIYDDTDDDDDSGQ